VGREAASAEVVRLLGRARLVTLTGAGGTGKSRLALHVAEQLRTGFRDGAFFADLSTVTDPGLVPSVLAQALGVPESGRPVLEAVGDHLRDKQLLLVVDNFEQVAAAGPVIERLRVASCRATIASAWSSSRRWPAAPAGRPAEPWGLVPRARAEEPDAREPRP
jgi:predicted ATPase